MRIYRRTTLAVAAVVGLAGLVAPTLATASQPRPGDHAARFRVGVNVANIDPTYPVYLGGYGPGRPGGTIQRATDPLTGKSEHLTVRAVAFEANRHVVEFATIDTQGDMAGYQEGPYGIENSRLKVAKFLAAHHVVGASPADIIVSSLHEHAVPTLFGVWAPPKHNLRYLASVSQAVTRALERAFLAVRPATVTAGTANAPWLGGGNLAEGNEFEGWPRDGALLALWARDAHTGKTIATFITEPAYPNMVYGPGDVIAKNGKPTSVIAHDFPGYLEELISQKLGGVTVVASGTLANQASPMQADSAPSPDLPKRHGLRYTRGFDDALLVAHVLANLTFGALARGHPLTNSVVGGAEQEVTTPVTNPPLAVLGLLTADQDDAGPIGQATGTYPVDRAFTPPYGYVAALNTWVTGSRIGNVLFLSEPGEFFGSIHFTWQRTIRGSSAVEVIGAGQDFLGYDYPVTTAPFTLLGGDELLLGPSLALGDQVVTAGEQDASGLGFHGDLLATPETSVTKPDEGQLAKPGVLLVPSAVAVDINRRTDVAPVRLLGNADPPRTSMTCENPALLTQPSSCPVPRPSMGAFHWRFGDGGSRVTSPQAHVRAYFSPYVMHDYRRPGRYWIAVSSADNKGRVAADSRVLRVYPALSACARVSGSVATAHVVGGDGHLLFATWRLAGGRTVTGPTLRLAPGEHATLTVLDGTGTTATAFVPTSSCATGAGGARPARRTATASLADTGDDAGLAWLAVLAMIMSIMATRRRRVCGVAHDHRESS